MTNTEKMMREAVVNICDTVMAEREKVSNINICRLAATVTSEMIKQIKQNPFKSYVVVSIDESYYTADEIEMFIGMIELYNDDTDNLNKYLTNLFTDIPLFREIEIEVVKEIKMIHFTIFFN